MQSRFHLDPKNLTRCFSDLQGSMAPLPTFFQLSVETFELTIQNARLIPKPWGRNPTWAPGARGVGHKAEGWKMKFIPGKINLKISRWVWRPIFNTGSFRCASETGNCIVYVGLWKVMIRKWNFQIQYQTKTGVESIRSAKDNSHFPRDWLQAGWNAIIVETADLRNGE